MGGLLAGLGLFWATVLILTVTDHGETVAALTDRVPSLGSGGSELASALAGAFVGAIAAFGLQMLRENQLKEDKEYAAIISAQHALLFKWRVLAAIRFRYLDAERENVAERHQRLSIYWIADHNIVTDLDSLTFLFRQGMRQVVSNCFFAERAYLSAIDAVKARNEYHNQATSGQPVAFDPVTKTGVYNYDPVADQMLRSATDALYHSVDNGMALCKVAFTELRRCAREVYPNSDFLKDENLTLEGIAKDLALAPLAKF